MTIVHRNKEDTEKRSYAEVAAIARVIPPIMIPASVAIQNSFSVLQEETSSDSEVDMTNFDWKSSSHASQSEFEESDTMQYDNLESSDASDSTEERAEDNSPESAEESAEESTSNSSQDELIVNHKHYRRVRQPWCKDGIPCFVTSISALLGFAYFMQFVFYMCGLVNDDCCSPAARLHCSKRF